MRRAERAEVDTIVEILEEAAQWLAGKGIAQWQVGGFIAVKDGIGLAVERGEYWLATIDGELAGVVKLQWDDKDFWGEQPPVAGYVHRLAVRRKYGGRGLGRRILRWAEDQVRAAGRPLIRLDCAAPVERLVEYYLAAGFEKRGLKKFTFGDRTLDVQLFEKAV